MSRLLPISLPAPSKLTGERVAVGCLEDRPTVVAGLSQALAKDLAASQSSPGWTASAGRIRRTAIGGGERVLELHGLGKADELDSRRLARWLAGLTADNSGSVSICLPGHESTEGDLAARRVLRQLALADYRYDTYRAPKPRTARTKVQLVAPSSSRPQYRRARRDATAVAEGIELARDLGNTPPNVATPAWMASRSRSLARELGFKIRVLGARDLTKLRMEGILSVARGSAQTPRLVRLEWGSRGPVVAVVGKGVTFDTGGISIKPATDMDEMKYDKCGACTALGLARAVALANLPVRLRVYLPLVENMPSSKAYRPGDIVRCYNGKTVEVINTDAEGRMILADALSWAAREKPDWLLDYATLTGASMVALGVGAGALFSGDDQLADGMLRAAEDSGERLWRLPLWPEFIDDMKGNHADLRNSAGRWGAACTAAAFLSQFVGGVERWAHIDIAGPAMSYKPKGATGYGIATAFRWLQELRPRRARA